VQFGCVVVFKGVVVGCDDYVVVVADCGVWVVDYYVVCDCLVFDVMFCEVF
jgi:hypothetical protein